MHEEIVLTSYCLQCTCAGELHIFSLGILDVKSSETKMRTLSKGLPLSAVHVGNVQCLLSIMKTFENVLFIKMIS